MKVTRGGQRIFDGYANVNIRINRSNDYFSFFEISSDVLLVITSFCIAKHLRKVKPAQVFY